MQRSIKHIYSDWRASLTKPDDSIFWYHPSLDCIVLRLAISCIASRPLLLRLGKAESLKLYDIYINEMVTAWIDDDPVNFEFPFNALMKLCEKQYIICAAIIREHKKLKQIIDYFCYTSAYWIPIAGDIDNRKIQKILDDITTDGKTIESEFINALILKPQHIVLKEGMNLNFPFALSMFNDAYDSVIKERLWKCSGKK